MHGGEHLTMEAVIEGLPVLERLLLHLHSVDQAGRGASPEAQTQVGIAAAIGIQRKHVPRAIRKLVEAGWIKLVLKHVDGRRQRLRVHVLSATGLEEVKRLRNTYHDVAVTTSHGNEKVLDVIDAGRLTELHTSGARDAQHAGDTAGAPLIDLAARLLGCSHDDVRGLISPDQPLAAEASTALSGAEAVFLSCLDTALTDGVITDDEEALLMTLRAELGPLGPSLNAHVASLLHDMMK